MPTQTSTAEKILRNIKGLRTHLQEGEEPVFAIPAIWDAGQGRTSTPCDVIVTNQRLIGFYMRSFPREHVFLDALNLRELVNVTWRQKSYEPVFREILVSDGRRNVYIRAPKRKCEALYAALREETEKISGKVPVENATTTTAEELEVTTTPRTAYGRQDIRTAFDTSILAVLILFVGGMLLEVIGILLWIYTQNRQIGLPLAVAGFAAVIAAILIRLQKR